MPRRGRGGRRQGIKGRDYKNRSDLAFNARAPTVENVPPSATYGAGAQQQNVVRSARAAQQARAVPQPNPVMQAAEAFVPPQLGALDRPTERPNEPFAAGLSIGAGSGPEVLPFQPRDEDLDALRRQLPFYEIFANQPGASSSFRNFVRRLRGSVPPL